ncbi:hypothetical protein [Lysobacter gummosus]|uniref:hypothetical protein n=1 Tax=Lysobacter gummosus TaxID=262324 RepID=UPI003626E094
MGIRARAKSERHALPRISPTRDAQLSLRRRWPRGPFAMLSARTTAPVPGWR